MPSTHSSESSPHPLPDALCPPESIAASAHRSACLQLALGQVTASSGKCGLETLLLHLISGPGCVEKHLGTEFLQKECVQILLLQFSSEEEGS